MWCVQKTNSQGCGGLGKGGHSQNKSQNKGGSCKTWDKCYCEHKYTGPGPFWGLFNEEADLRVGKVIFLGNCQTFWKIVNYHAKNLKKKFKHTSFII